MIGALVSFGFGGNMAGNNVNRLPIPNWSEYLPA